MKWDSYVRVSTSEFSFVRFCYMNASIIRMMCYAYFAIPSLFMTIWFKREICLYIQISFKAYLTSQIEISHRMYHNHDIRIRYYISIIPIPTEEIVFTNRLSKAQNNFISTKISRVCMELFFSFVERQYPI